MNKKLFIILKEGEQNLPSKILFDKLLTKAEFTKEEVFISYALDKWYSDKSKRKLFEELKFHDPNYILVCGIEKVRLFIKTFKRNDRLKTILWQKINVPYLRGFLIPSMHQDRLITGKQEVIDKLLEIFKHVKSGTY